MLGIRVIFFMGNGRRVRFWLYKWCDNELLRHSFPSLLIFSILGDIWVVDIQSPSNGGCWIFCFYRRLHGYKVDTFEKLLRRLQG